MSKNQSIMSFFKSKTNQPGAEVKSEATAIKTEQKDEIKSSPSKPDTPSNKRSREPSPAKPAVTTAAKSSPRVKATGQSAKSKTTKVPAKKATVESSEDEKENGSKIATDDKANNSQNNQSINSDFDDEGSPIKKSSTKKESKRLRIESSSEEEEVKPKEVKPKVVKPKEVKPKEVKPKEVKPKEVKPKEEPSPQKKQPSPEKKQPSPSPKKKSLSPERKQPSPERAQPSSEKKSPKSPKQAAKATGPVSSLFSNMKKAGLANGPDSATMTYKPDKDHYHPIKDACWEKGQPVPYRALAQTFYCMEKTTKRLELLSIVTNYFRSVLALTPNDLVPSMYLLTNKVAPDYENIELGIGDTVLFKSLAEATGSTVPKLKIEFQTKGDIGLVAEANRCNQKLLFVPKKLSVGGVFGKLKEIAKISGNSSQQKKCDLIKSLLVACDSIEARYLMRSLTGKLRNGLGEQSILSSLGHACLITPPLTVSDDQSVKQITDRFEKMRHSDQLDEIKKKLEKAAQQVKSAYYQCPNYDRVITAITDHGLDKLSEHCKLTPGVPLRPMLAYPTKGIHEVLKRFEGIEFTCEYKYDGERAQIHVLEDGSFQIYSRNLEHNTSKYPDVIEFLQGHLGVGVKAAAAAAAATEVVKKESDDAMEVVVETKAEPAHKVVSAILDAEVVAYDIEKKIIQPFQKLSTRKRKDAASEDIKVQVCLFAFDLIYLNGESMIGHSLRQRRERMYSYFPKVEGKLHYATSMDANDLDHIQEFLDNSIRDGCEGLMIKTLDEEAHYEISKRSHNWLKLKKDYLEGVGDTLDLVVIGGYLGAGKRTGLYGGYLLAVYDPENEEYQTVCKLGTGLKDNDLQSQFESLSKIKIDKAKSYYRVDDTLEQPDHWFEAEQVWEIKCADFSLSPVHTAALGLVESGKGISLRFPRFLRLRDDKKAEDATSNEQLSDMYKNQQQMINLNENNAKKSQSDNEDEED